VRINRANHFCDFFTFGRVVIVVVVVVRTSGLQTADRRTFAMSKTSGQPPSPPPPPQSSSSVTSAASSSSHPTASSHAVAVSAEDNFDFLFKIVLIGDCGTGKTCVVQRFKSGTYAENQGNTIGVDFSMKTVKIDGKKVKASNDNGNAITTIITIVVTAPDMGHGRPREVSHDHPELLPVGQRSPVG